VPEYVVKYYSREKKTLTRAPQKNKRKMDVGEKNVRNLSL
jgi:hypothetical protein